MRGARMVSALAMALFLEAILYSFSQGAEKPFYQGKTVTIFTTGSPGGGFDQYARLLAKHMPRYISGQPQIIVSPLGGSSAIIEGNLIQSAKPDGLTLLMMHNQLYLEQLKRTEGVRFDLSRLTWIGNAGTDSLGLVMRDPFETLEEVRRAKNPLNFGASVGGASYMLPALLKEALGLNFKIITGYSGGERRLALARGELDGIATSVGSAYRELRDELSTGRVQFVIQTGLPTKGGGHEPDPHISKVPLVRDMKMSPEAVALTELVLGAHLYTRPLVGPPGMPEDRTRILREAFMKALGDPNLLADAEKQRMNALPVDSATIQTFYQKLINQPPSVVKQIEKIFGPG
ncbi:MAG: hypothetical protein HYY45_00695 [Deltaproteobacteria bacterium]|nr:hypothetical protein [Deltaproteobacteria bacterium]